MTEQPHELREYLVEAEAIAREWYSRKGLEETHERNIDALATLTGLTWVTGGALQFGELRDLARVYLVAAFQMGRAGAHDDDSCALE